MFDLLVGIAGGNKSIGEIAGNSQVRVRVSVRFRVTVTVRVRFRVRVCIRNIGIMCLTRLPAWSG